MKKKYFINSTKRGTKECDSIRTGLSANAPGFIFSNPTARTQSFLPVSINCLAKIRAVDPVAQLLFTL